jgi:hypothetical protein
MLDAQKSWVTWMSLVRASLITASHSSVVRLHVAALPVPFRYRTSFSVTERRLLSACTTVAVDCRPPRRVRIV